MSAPSLAIVIPTYNRAAMLERCVASAMAGLDADPALAARVSVIVSDDGSTLPEARAALARLARSHAGGPLTILRAAGNSGGASAPRNAALAKLDADYVLFLDSDDYLGEGAVPRLLALLEAHRPDYVYPNSVNDGDRSDRSDQLRQPWEERPLLLALRSLVARRVFRVGLIRQLGLTFDETLRVGEDLLFTFVFMINATRFGYAGGHDYYHLVAHSGGAEDGHLSHKGARDGISTEVRAAGVVRILRRGLEALAAAPLAPELRARVAAELFLPRMLRMLARHLGGIGDAGRRAAILADLEAALATLPPGVEAEVRLGAALAAVRAGDAAGFVAAAG